MLPQRDPPERVSPAVGAGKRVERKSVFAISARQHTTPHPRTPYLSRLSVDVTHTAQSNPPADTRARGYSTSHERVKETEEEEEI